ncbi:GDP-L-fucose synthase [Fusobacterium sp.]|uniref:GDP-L-fucose synthase family protein n=1 Tax=Fusobacterium sp. TaxID=68766 RepID=UPI0025BA2531|nr:GDP-L-fucose synthase [Fusobacterium sp.]
MDLKEKKIIVTGGAGFLGSHVVEKLLERGCKKENIFIPRSKKYNLTQIQDVERMYLDFKADIVIHIAADIGGIGYSKTHPASQFYNNLMINTLVQDLAYKHGIEKFVGVGTVCSYPKYTPVPFKEEDLWLGYPEETNAAYGLSKKMMLVQSQAYRQQYNFNAIHLLMINLYGPRDNFSLENSHVIPALIRKIIKANREDSDIEVWGDGTASREFIYVEDAAEAIVLATELYNGAEPINIGNGEEITIKELVQILGELLKYRGKIIWDTSKPNGQPKRRLDVSKALEFFKFKAKVDFEQGLRNTIHWYLENEDNMNG